MLAAFCCRAMALMIDDASNKSDKCLINAWINIVIKLFSFFQHLV